jgi:antitoxin ParD1/3/4
METMNISLTSTMRQWVNSQVQTGEYANASDYVRDLIRHDQRHHEELNLALIQGENSGKSKRKVADIIAATKAKIKDE